jgi:hypothetical protein
MKKFGKILISGLLLIGCGAGNTEQTRTTVSDYNILAGSTVVEHTKNTSENKASLNGTWKLVSKTGAYPHAVGSNLTISNNTFSLTDPSASGSCASQNSTFLFNFSGGMIFNFTYNILGNTLSFVGKGNGMTMTYSRS